jgi:hypothetical protein
LLVVAENNSILTKSLQGHIFNLKLLPMFARMSVHSAFNEEAMFIQADGEVAQRDLQKERE